MKSTVARAQRPPSSGPVTLTWVSEANPRSEERFMVHPRRRRRSGWIELKFGLVVLLVLLCDTYGVRNVYTIICQVLVVIWVLI